MTKTENQKLEKDVAMLYENEKDPNRIMDELVIRHGTDIELASSIVDKVTSRDSIIFSGSAGYSLEWILTAGGTLTISGNGEMEEYMYNTFKWGCEVQLRLTGYDFGINTVIIKNGVTSVGRSAFLELHRLRWVKLPDSLTSIGDYAFGDCSKLKYITIPAGVTSFGKEIFYRCNRLSIMNLACIPQIISKETFADSSMEDYYPFEQHICTLHVPAASVKAYRSAVGWNKFGNIVAIEAGQYYKDRFLF
jgi:hypothetical protein